MEKDETFKIMLWNSVTLHKEQPYCYKCSIPIENWNEALSHVQSQEHTSLIQNYEYLCSPKLVNFSPMKCKTWVNNGIVVNTIKEVNCLLCSCTLATLDDLDHIEQHITGKHHTSALSVSKLINTYHSKDDKSEKSYKEILLENKLTATISSYLICTACLCTLSSLHNIAEHIKAKRHIKRIQIVELQRTMVNAEEIKHDANHNFIGDNTLCKVKTQQEKDIISSYSNHGIVQGKAECFTCNICLCSGMLLETALKHIKDNHHLTALKNSMSMEKMKVFATTETLHNDEHFGSGKKTKYLNDGMKKNARTQWFQQEGIIVGDYNTVICTVCFRALPSLSHDVQHLEGRRHNNATKAVRKADISPLPNFDTNLEKDNSKLTRKTIESDDLSYETAQQIIQRNISSSLCHSCTVNVGISNHNAIDDSKTRTNSQYRNAFDLRMIVPHCYDHSSSRKDSSEHSLNETYYLSNSMIGVRCLCCKVILYTEESVKEHFSSKEHEANIQRMLQSVAKIHFGGTKYAALTHTNTFKEYETFSLCNLILVDEEITFLTIKVRWKNVSDTSINNGITDVLLTCNICHVKLENPCNLTEHFSGRKHMENGIKESLIQKQSKDKKKNLLPEAFNMLSISNKKENKGTSKPFVIPPNICNLTLNAIKQNPAKHTRSDTNQDKITSEQVDTKDFLNIEERMYSSDILNHGYMITGRKSFYCLICKIFTVTDKEELIYHMHYCNAIKMVNLETLLLEVTEENKKNRTELILELQKYMDKWYWYSINRFCCLLCCVSFMNKSKFINHILHSHATLNNPIYEGCMACSTLWVSKSRCMFNHTFHQMHLYLKESKLFYVETLPVPAGELFKDIKVVIDELYQLSENILVSNTQKRLKTSLKAFLKNILGFLTSNVKVRFFGPRSIGLTFSESNVYIVIDKVEREDIDNVEENEAEEWYVMPDKHTVTQICHKETHLVCDVCAIGDAEIRKSKILRMFCKQYQPCRRLILFLKKWLSCCSLHGGCNISDEALTWLVIFSLQANSHLPSVQLHQAEKSECQEAMANPIEPKTIHYLLVEFFTFYADFDYRRYVISPFMGCKVRKEYFTEIYTLPKEMHQYYIKNPRGSYLDLGNSLCLQDPVDLYVNLTKNVKSVTLKHFREYCKKSMMVLSDTKT